ncbi:unnamed protein product [Citrullus colocynthis]|uniref:Uncharacterized protein n=1 Tax=Citrullus colocynthis TaxID=252529 RepID=A0ABP0YZJ5_9ROSI
MITNRLPYSAENHGPFRARFFRLLFSSNIPNLSEARIVATLWGCMMRRICQSPYARMEVTPRWVNLDYNNIVGLIRNPKGNVEGIKGERAKSSEQVYLVSQGFEQEGLAGENQAKLGKGRQENGSNEFKQANSEEIPTFSCFDFACIPLKKPNKKEEGIKEKRKSQFDLYTRKYQDQKVEARLEPDDGENPTWQKQIFYESRRKGASFLNVWRTKNPEVKDYATWPSQLTWHLCLPFTVNWAIGRRKDGWYSYTSYSEAKPKKNLERKGTW